MEKEERKEVYDTPVTDENGSPISIVWKPDLYKLQQESPKPQPVFAPSAVSGCPFFYGLEYHGAMNHKEANSLLTDDEYLEKSIIINYFMTDSIMCHKNDSIQLMILLQMVW